MSQSATRTTRTDGKVGSSASKLLASSGRGLQRAFSVGMSAGALAVKRVASGVASAASSMSTKVRPSAAAMAPQRQAVTSQKRLQKIDQKALIQRARQGGGAKNMQALNKRKQDLLRNKEHMFKTAEGQTQWKSSMQKLQQNYATKAKRADIRAQQPALGRQDKIQAKQQLTQARKMAGTNPGTQQALDQLNARKRELLKQKMGFPGGQPTEQWKRDMARLQQRYRNVTSGVPQKPGIREQSQQPRPSQAQVKQNPSHQQLQGIMHHDTMQVQSRQPSMRHNQVQPQSHQITPHHARLNQQPPSLAGSAYPTHGHLGHIGQPSSGTRVMLHHSNAISTAHTNPNEHGSCDPETGMCIVPYDRYQQLLEFKRARQQSLKVYH